MTSSKESQTAPRSLVNYRQSISSGPPNPLAAARPGSHSRNNSSSHTHSILTGGLNARHGVSRRKSVTSSAAAVAAVAAVLGSEAGDKISPLPTTRRGTMSKPGVVPRSGSIGSLPTPPCSLPTQTSLSYQATFMPVNINERLHDSAIDDEPNDNRLPDDGDEGAQRSETARIRRASDGQPLGPVTIKDSKKSSRAELRCEKCGKGYKHSSCLTKHLWEHTPEWSLTSKLLISKHQQVQLLEAASVLVAMNLDSDAQATSPGQVKDSASSDPDSASPDSSNYSDTRDGRSSVDTTPPPHSEDSEEHESSYGWPSNSTKRFSGNNFFARSLPAAGTRDGISMFHTMERNRDSPDDLRPSSSGRNKTSQDDKELAAAVATIGLMSGSFGSNVGSKDIRLPEDAPPVPPVPSQFLDQAAFPSTSFINSVSSRSLMPESYTRGDHPGSTDVKMDDSDDSILDDDEDERPKILRSVEDDGMFRMEE